MHGYLPTELWQAVGRQLKWEDHRALRLVSRYISQCLQFQLHGFRLLHLINNHRNEDYIRNELKKYKWDLMVHDHWSRTVIHLAATENLGRLLEDLLRYPNVRSMLNRPEEVREDTALTCAARFGHQGICAQLVDAGADVNSKNCYRVTALYWAIRRRETSAVKLLLSKGADYSQRLSYGEYTPLILAVTEGSEPLVLSIIAAGGELEQTDADGLTPLMWAVTMDDISMVRLLLRHGAKTSHKSYTSRDRRLQILTPTMGRRETMELIIASFNTVGGKAIQCAETGLSPLILAIIYYNPDIAGLLIENGAKIEECDGSGRSPMMWALITGDIEMIHLLCRYGADISDTRFDVSLTNLSAT